MYCDSDVWYRCDESTRHFVFQCFCWRSNENINNEPIPINREPKNYICPLLWSSSSLSFWKLYPNVKDHLLMSLIYFTLISSNAIMFSLMLWSHGVGRLVWDAGIMQVVIPGTLGRSWMVYQFGRPFVLCYFDAISPDSSMISSANYITIPCRKEKWFSLKVPLSIEDCADDILATLL